MVNEIVYVFIFFFGKKKFLKLKLDNIEINFMEKRLFDSEIKKMWIFIFFFIMICNIVLIILLLWKYIYLIIL